MKQSLSQLRKGTASMTAKSVLIFNYLEEHYKKGDTFTADDIRKGLVAEDVSDGAVSGFFYKLQRDEAIQFCRKEGRRQVYELMDLSFSRAYDRYSKGGVTGRQIHREPKPIVEESTLSTDPTITQLADLVRDAVNNYLGHCRKAILTEMPTRDLVAELSRRLP
jgi:hypothetical protein